VRCVRVRDQRRIDAKSLFFRESNAPHDICIPLSQVENLDQVSEGDNYISVSKWFLKKLDEEGRRLASNRSSTGSSS